MATVMWLLAAMGELTKGIKLKFFSFVDMFMWCFFFFFPFIWWTSSKFLCVKKTERSICVGLSELVIKGKA